jgi:hypothetical protein
MDVAALIQGILDAAGGVGQSVTGWWQLEEAKKLEKQYPRPEAKVAPSINTMTDYLYGKSRSQDIAGGDIARGEIKGATSAGIKAASELGQGSEAYGALGKMVGSEQNAFAQLAGKTGEQNLDWGKMYAQALQAKAGEENRMWEWNKAAPYLQAANLAAQYKSSGTQNLIGGIIGGGQNAVQDFDTAFSSESNSGKSSTMDTETYNYWLNNVKSS